MDKPRICEVLGVEIGERFKFDNFEYELTADGGMKWYSNCGSGNNGVNSLIKIINHPERIIRKPHFTQQDIEDAKAVRRTFGRGGTIKRCNKVESEPYSNLTFNHFYINSDLFPSINAGQEYTLDEIIGGAK